MNSRAPRQAKQMEGEAVPWSPCPPLAVFAASKNFFMVVGASRPKIMAANVEHRFPFKPIVLRNPMIHDGVLATTTTTTPNCKYTAAV